MAASVPECQVDATDRHHDDSFASEKSSSPTDSLVQRRWVSGGLANECILQNGPDDMHAGRSPSTNSESHTAVVTADANNDLPECCSPIVGGARRGGLDRVDPDNSCCIARHVSSP
jgi:hypothetical protein